MRLKNIIFDIGNVLLRWDPLAITIKTFPGHPNPQELSTQIFKNQIWFDLNLGKLTEEEAILKYHRELGISKLKLVELMEVIKDSLIPVGGSLELLQKLYDQGFSLYCITDNVKEIVTYLRGKYSFWSLFKGVVVSADIGYLKSSPEIFFCLLNEFKLDLNETLFIDDHLPNIEEAQRIGLYSYQFSTAKECTKFLKDEFKI